MGQNYIGMFSWWYRNLGNNGALNVLERRVCLVSYSNRKNIVLIDSILMRHFFLFFSFMVLSFLHKWIKRPTCDLSNAICITVNWMFEFDIRKQFWLFSTDVQFLMFHNNSANILEILNKRNLLQTCLQALNANDFHSQKMKIIN